MMFTLVILYSASKDVFDDDVFVMLLTILAMLLDLLIVIAAMGLLL